MSRGKRYTAEQIIKILREVEIYTSRGQNVEQAVRACSISEQTYYRWRKEYGGINIDQAKRFKDMEKENLRLRKAAQLTWVQATGTANNLAKTVPRQHMLDS